MAKRSPRGDKREKSTEKRQKVRDIFGIPREKRTPMQVATVFSYWRTTVTDWKDANEKIDTLIPRKTLAELTKLTAGFDEEISLGMDENHIYFQVGPRLLISRMLYGQFPNYEMVMPKNNDKSVEFNSSLLNHAIRRVALMADERSHAIRFHLEPNQLVISSQNAEEGEANETLQTDYNGDITDIGFNAQYLQEFLNVIGDAKIAFEFKDSNSQAQLHPSENGDFDYKYVVMPMRI